MVFRRTRKQVVYSLFSLVIVAGVSVWSLRDGLLEGETALTFWGVICGVWAAYILLVMVRRTPLGHMDETGLVLNYVFSRKTIAWSDLTWFRAEPGKRAAIFAYRKSGDEKDRLAILSQRVLGEDQMTAIRAAVETHRPGLPDTHSEAQVFS